MRRCQFGQRNTGLNTAVELPHCDGKDALEHGLFWKRAWDYWKWPAGHSAFLASAPLSFSRRAFGSSGPFLRHLRDLEDGAHSGGEVMLNFGPKSPSVCSGSQSCSWLRSSKKVWSQGSQAGKPRAPHAGVCWEMQGTSVETEVSSGGCHCRAPQMDLTQVYDWRRIPESSLFAAVAGRLGAASSNTSLTCAFCSRSEAERRRRVCWGRGSKWPWMTELPEDFVTVSAWCLAGAGMAAWSWTVASLLSFSRTYRDICSLVCSFVHLFISTFV